MKVERTNDMNIRRIFSRGISYVLILSILVTNLVGCGKSVPNTVESSQNVPTIDTEQIAEMITEEIQEEVQLKEEQKKSDAEEVENAQKNIDYFVYERLFKEYSVAFDTFDAVLKLPDGSEINGIGYSDLASYFEPVGTGKGYFPAGFLIDGSNVVISQEDIDKGLEIENLSYQNDDYGFVFAYNTEPYLEHCVVDGKYVQYGIDKNGNITHEECEYSRDVCDTSIGALYSYDENKYLYDPNVGEYVDITGDSLFETIDYDALEAEVNRILDEQDFNFSSVDIKTTAYFAKEAVNSYLLSLQDETFMGCNVNELIKEVSELDPMQCIRITPDGNVVIDIEKDLPQKPSAVAKWTVGICCGIAVAGSVALNVFVPAATPVSGSICGAAIDVFMQVVVENHAVEDINWGKVAISATSGALMAWACPLGAATITKSVATKTGSAVLSKLAGYGILTFSNAMVSGVTNASFTLIDKGSKEDVFDSFLVGVALGACFTVAASTLSEVGHTAMKALAAAKPQNWLVKLSNNASSFIGEHQVKLFSDSVENVLSPKSVYEASQAGIAEYNKQATLAAGKKGGGYNEVKQNSNGEYTQVHETPSFESTGANTRTEGNGPSIKMTKEDHRLTASYGSSNDAKEYRAAQKALIEKGNYHDAIQMDIDDIHLKFGDKYDDAISEMLEYAELIGWW